MRLAVFGSTGRIGSLVVKESLRRGHQITAFTRRPELLDPTLPSSVRVVAGDGRDPAAVGEAVTGTDAVIAVIGPASPRGPHEVAAVSRVVTQSMRNAGSRRLVVTSAYPIVADQPHLLVAVLRKMFSVSYADLAEMERVVMASDLDWTIARLNRLTNRPGRGGLVVSREQLSRASSISRAAVAATLVEIGESDVYSRSAINIGGGRRAR